MLLSEGKDVDNPVSATTMAMVLKMLDNLPNLQQFERVLNREEAVVFKEKKPEKPSEVKDDSDTPTEVRDIGNMFEARTEAVKKKINGQNVKN